MGTSSRHLAPANELGELRPHTQCINNGNLFKTVINYFMNVITASPVVCEQLAIWLIRSAHEHLRTCRKVFCAPYRIW